MDEIQCSYCEQKKSVNKFSRRQITKKMPRCKNCVTEPRDIGFGLWKFEKKPCLSCHSWKDIWEFKMHSKICDTCRSEK